MRYATLNQTDVQKGMSKRRTRLKEILQLLSRGENKNDEEVKALQLEASSLNIGIDAICSDAEILLMLIDNFCGLNCSKDYRTYIEITRRLEMFESGEFEMGDDEWKWLSDRLGKIDLLMKNPKEGTPVFNPYIKRESARVILAVEDARYEKKSS